MCNCDYCLLFSRLRDSGLGIEDINLIENVFMDHDYHQAVLSGVWPNAVEVLTEALEKAKENQNV